MERANEITISLREYTELTEKAKWLDCLTAAGVDNWNGCEIAQDFLNSGELHVV